MNIDTGKLEKIFKWAFIGTSISIVVGMFLTTVGSIFYFALKGDLNNALVSVLLTLFMTICICGFGWIIVSDLNYWNRYRQ